jgi:Domain of unknown function (DUF4201)
MHATNLHQVESQLRQKDDMGDALHYIDFHQLQIENKQHVARIEERNAELLRLKTATGRAVQALSSLKCALQQAQADGDWLAGEVGHRTGILAKTGTDLVTVQVRCTVVWWFATPRRVHLQCWPALQWVDRAYGTGHIWAVHPNCSTKRLR